MKRIALLGLLSVGIAALVCVFARNTQLRSQQQVRKAFTASLVHRAYTSDWREGLSQNRVYAVKSDGSRADVLMVETPDHRLVQNRSVVQIAMKRKIGIGPETESITTYPLSDAAVRSYQSYTSVCTSGANPERSTILGYEVVRVQEDRPSPQGYTLHRDAWLAPSLACYPLRETTTGGPVGGPQSINTNDVLFVAEGDPPPSLFEIPSTYTERTPSQAAEEYARRFPGHSIFGQGTAKRLDNVYTAHQRNR